MYDFFKSCKIFSEIFGTEYFNSFPIFAGLRFPNPQRITPALTGWKEWLPLFGSRSFQSGSMPCYARTAIFTERQTLFLFSFFVICASYYRTFRHNVSLHRIDKPPSGGLSFLLF